jgi:bacteriorhodopsin
MTGHGYKLVDGRVFHYARYIDWLVTTPLLLLDLGALAGISIEDSLMLVALDVLMVLCGFAGGLSHGNSSLVMWILGCGFFLPIVFDLAVTFRAKAKVVSAAASVCYDKLVVLTVLLWTAYPVVFYLGEYKEIISTTTEIGLYMGLDVSAKCVFGFVLLTSRKALERDTQALIPSSDPKKEDDAESLPLSEPISKGDASA